MYVGVMIHLTRAVSRNSILCEKLWYRSKNFYSRRVVCFVGQRLRRSCASNQGTEHRTSDTWKKLWTEVLTETNELLAAEASRLSRERQLYYVQLKCSFAIEWGDKQTGLMAFNVAAFYCSRNGRRDI